MGTLEVEEVSQGCTKFQYTFLSTNSIKVYMLLSIAYFDRLC